MLKEAFCRALNNVVRITVIKQKTKQRTFRDDAADLWHDLLVFRAGKNIFEKSRAVIIIDHLDPFPYAGITEGRSVHGVIASFGMTSDPKRTAGIFQIERKIGCCMLLPRCIAQETQI